MQHRKKVKRAWLLTWDWAGDHAQVNPSFVAILSSRYSDTYVQRVLEQYYVSSSLSLEEQLAYVKSRKNCPYKIEHGTMAVSERLQKRHSLGPHIQSPDSMIIGANPWLWARIVKDLETWTDDNNVEHLKWQEQDNICWDGKMRSDWTEASLELVPDR